VPDELGDAGDSDAAEDGDEECHAHGLDLYHAGALDEDEKEADGDGDSQKDGLSAAAVLV
jgi:hypothetical protein